MTDLTLLYEKIDVLIDLVATLNIWLEVVSISAFAIVIIIILYNALKTFI